MLWYGTYLYLPACLLVVYVRTVLQPEDAGPQQVTTRCLWPREGVEHVAHVEVLGVRAQTTLWCTAKTRTV